MSADHPVTVGVIGLGRAGWGIHVRLLRDRDDFKIVSVADPEADRRKQAEDELGADAFEGIDALLGGSDAELIIVATASMDHVPHGVLALDAGRHVVIEKPMATDTAGARRLLDAAERSGRMFTVHQSARWGEEFVFVRNLLRDERLGEVYYIRRGGYGFGRRNDWQRLGKYQGGTLNNNGVHLLDGCRLLMESKIVDVFGDLQQVLSPGDTEDTVKVVMRGANGRIIDCELFEACSAQLPSWVVLGTRGSVVIRKREALIRWLKTELPRLDVSDQALVPGRKYGIVGKGRETLEWGEETVEAKAECESSFYDLAYKAVRKGAPPPVDPAVCFEVVEVMERARGGRPVLCRV